VAESELINMLFPEVVPAILPVCVCLSAVLLAKAAEEKVSSCVSAGVL
jgi:hypothetical protein